MFALGKEYNIIKDIKKEVLEKYCKDNNLNFDLSTIEGRWGAFAHYTGDTEYHLKGYELISFTNMICIAIADTQLEENTERYFKEYLIGNHVFKEYECLDNDSSLSSDEKLVKLFNFISELYTSPDFYDKYEILSVTKAVRLSLNDLEKLDKYPGKDISSKIRYLIRLNY